MSNASVNAPSYTPEVSPSRDGADPFARRPWQRFGALADSLGLLAVLAVLTILFGILSDYFLSPITLRTLLNQVPALTLVSIGMTYVLVIAGIDLSVGSVMAFSSAVLGYALIGWSVGLPTAILLALGTGLLCGLFNGSVTVAWSIPSFIVTLGALEMARGGAYLVTGSQTSYLGSAVEVIGDPVPVLGVSPAFIVALVLVILAQVVLSRTVFGRYMIAIGTNREAVRLSGINPRSIEVAVFALSGMLAGLAGVMHVGYLGSADPNAGIGLELSAIAAVVIGGTSLMGGRGSVVNAFLGVLIIAVLQVGLAQVGATEPTKRVLTGAVIVAAVILDAYRHRLAGQRYRLLAVLFRRRQS